MSCQQQEEQQTAKMELVREEEHGKQAKRNKTKRHERKAEKEEDEQEKNSICGRSETATSCTDACS